MSEFDLDSKLKVVRVPERGEDYWEMFPRRVLVRARATPLRRPRSGWLPRLAWGSSVAFACLMMSLCLGHSRACPLEIVSHAMQSAKSFRSELVQLPKQARALMRIDHGLHSLIEEQP